MSNKDAKHVDRVVRFRSSFDPSVPSVPSAPDQYLQDLILVPLVFAFPEGGTAELEPAP